MPSRTAPSVVRTLRSAVAASILSSALSILPALPAHAAEPPQKSSDASLASTWITLGTNSGPNAKPTKSEPAHLLMIGQQRVLIDCGDGAGEQLAKAGVSVRTIDAIVLSHLHFDHTGGLYGILGMRFQLTTPGVLTVYGPPGTRRTVEGLLAAMQPEAESGWGLPGAPLRQPADTVRVVEVSDGSHFAIGAIKVTAARNSHYSYKKGSDEDKRFQSLAYRFDLPTRSIAYTGDTGPSAEVEELSKGVDILFTEILDPEATMDFIRKNYTDIPAAAVQALSEHMYQQHLSPEAVGSLAKKTNPGKVVLIHNDFNDAQVQHAISIIQTQYKGPVVEAHDLDKF